MTKPTETRESLLIRLRNGDCDEAWDEFAEIYQPMMLRIARQSGLQGCDADDVAQRVLMSVHRAIGSWQKDESKGTFRAWLTTITKNAIRNAVTRIPRDRLLESTQLFQLFESESPDQSEIERHIETEFMRSVFRVASERVKAEFKDSTWKAFWRSTVDSIPIDQVAKELETNRGSIYASRSRVMRRLQQVTQQILKESESP